MYESVINFHNDKPCRLLFAAVSYYVHFFCTCASNTIREREGEGSGGREGKRY